MSFLNKSDYFGGNGFYLGIHLVPSLIPTPREVLASRNTVALLPIAIVVDIAIVLTAIKMIPQVVVFSLLDDN